ncbi:MAG: hypothetical protein KDA69_09535 [Planctomycetaceae bacterium]|nr:hypothetical protein [Planctomycetaceae bacterium]MCA9044551.1 hypothetical protein [Planctomycetaceae bacterium]
MDSKHSRAPKQLGDFGEGLVTYALIRKGFEVACVDHVGADLIAERDGNRIAVSVKSRLFRVGSRESRVTVFRDDHLDKLDHFAERFSLEPVLAQVICLADDRLIHLFIMKSADIRSKLKKVKHGYSLNYGEAKLEITTTLPFVDYSCWKDETIQDGLFVKPSE